LEADTALWYGDARVKLTADTGKSTAIV